MIFRERRIYISDDTLDQAILDRINDVYPVAPASGDHVVRGKLKTLLDGVHFTSTRIYNVGKGNLIRLSRGLRLKF